jgi:hypothetical protein
MLKENIQTSLHEGSENSGFLSLCVPWNSFPHSFLADVFTFSPSVIQMI